MAADLQYPTVHGMVYLVLEEEDATEEAEQVGGQQGEVDRRGAGHLHHYRHAAVQGVHACRVGRK